MPQDKLYYLLRSRKFWATVVVITVALAGPAAGLSNDAVTKIVITVSAYILGTALEDGLTHSVIASEAKQSPPNKEDQ